jgi:hypothetical protein
MRRFLAGLLYLFMGLPLALSGLLLFAVQPWALERDFYKKAVDDPRLSSLLSAPGIGADMDKVLVLGESSFDGPALVSALQPRLPLGELRSTGKAFIDAAFDDLEGRRTAPSVDLRPLKKAFSAVAPAIGQSYAAGIPASSLALPPGDYSARPAGQSESQAGREAAKALEAALAKLPDSVPVDFPEVVGPGTEKELTTASLGRAALGTSLLAAALIAAFATLGGGGIWMILARAGSMVGWPSAIVLALGAILAIPGASILEKALPPEARLALSSLPATELRGWLGGLLGTISRSFFVTGLVGASLAGLLSSLKRIGRPVEDGEDDEGREE